VAHIIKFAIHGLAGRNVVYEKTLDRHVNVFFGLNGSGKTSLLKILDSAMAADASPLADVPFTSAQVTLYTEQFKRELVRTIDHKSIVERTNKEGPGDMFVRADGTISRSNQVLWESQPQDAALQGPYRHAFLPISRMATVPANSFGAPTLSGRALEEQLNRSFAENLTQVWQLYVNTLNAEVRAAQSQGLANILRDVLVPKDRKTPTPVQNTDAAYANLTSFLQRQGSSHILPSEAAFKQRYAEDQALRSVVSDIDAVESRITEAMEPRARLQSLIGKMFAGGKSVLFGDDKIQVRLDDQREIPLGQLSSGEKQVLRLLIEQLRVDISSILIDEPELSMHVDWQRELISSMRALNPHSQIILATHSPEIMAEVDDSTIFRL
jgi:predicted ATPase